ncbi:MAG: hypothetical protein Aureis2KO_25210 [Aureisphaera sp.]
MEQAIVNENTTQLKAQTKAFVPPAPVIQKKLKIGPSDDPMEAEADAMADQVVQQKEMATPPTPNKGPLVQKKCSSCEEEELQKKPLVESITPLVQKRSLSDGGNAVASEGISSQIESSRGQGSSMDKGTRNFMENGFGTDFSEVNIHTDNNAIQLSKSLNAQAFTVGNDIYFNEGKYNPNTTSGKHLLAHELTHTIQQGGAEIKKMDAETEEAYFDELDELYEIIEDADAAKDYDGRNFFIRVAISLEFDEANINNIDDFYHYKSIAEMNASSEYDTLDHMGEDAIYIDTRAFPEIWADKIYDLLYINDPDLASLRGVYEGFYEVAEKESETIPDAIIERGFPVYYDDLNTLKRFKFNTAHASIGIEHPIKEFTIAMLKYGRSKWRDVYINSWNLGVESMTEAIRKGEYAVEIDHYQKFMDNNHDELLQELPEKAKELFSEGAFEQFSDDLVSLQESLLIAGFAATFGTLLGVLFFVGEADKIFEDKRAIANTTFNGLASEDKAIAAIKWAYYNGYYGKAGEQIWQQITQHGWLILAAVMAMIVALIAGHVFPPLGVALDAILIVLGGIDLIIALDELVRRVKAAGNANSLESLQKESGKLALVIVNDGLQIILELAGFLAGKAISKSFSKIKGEATDISTAEALARAIESTDEGMEMLDNARKSSRKSTKGADEAVDSPRVRGDADIPSRQDLKEEYDYISANVAQVKAVAKEIDGVHYVEEIVLPNKHTWRKKQDGKWCRFSTRYCLDDEDMDYLGLEVRDAESARLSPDAPTEMPAFVRQETIDGHTYDIHRPTGNPDADALFVRNSSGMEILDISGMPLNVTSAFPTRSLNPDFIPPKIRTSGNKLVDNVDNKTNRELAKSGRAPYLSNGDPVELHHLKQNFFKLEEQSAPFHQGSLDDLHVHPNSDDPAYISWRHSYVWFDGKLTTMGKVYDTLRGRYWKKRF